MSFREYSSVPPPSNLNSRQSYTKADDVDAVATAARAKFESRFSQQRRPKVFGDEEDDYFERDDDHQYQSKKQNKNEESDDDDEEDPLDAFMAHLEKNEKTKTKTQTKKYQSSDSKSLPVETTSTKKGVRQDIEEEDVQESYYKFMEANPNAGVGTFVGDSDDEDQQQPLTSQQQIEYDEDGNPIVPLKKAIDPLPVIYHSQIEYPSFEKNFYQEHEDIIKLTSREVSDLRHKLGLKVSGPDPPKPVTSFAHFGFDESLMKVIRKMEYTTPTPIQAQAIPAALRGRDLIGIAKTGSGKTAAYIWPLLIHVLDQPPLQPADGCIGLILAPTRELSQQIYQEAKRFAKPYNIRVLCAYGGGSKYEQSLDLQEGADIVVATPGRIIDFVKMKATNLLRVTYLVLDEADRMFDMGFEYQVRSICNHIRPDRQTLMFSATFKNKIEKLARDVLADPVRIVQGDVGDANQDVTQIVLLFKSGTPQKWDWLTKNLVDFTSQGSVLIFVTKKQNAQELCDNLKSKTSLTPLLLHGDMNQFDRNKVITSFKKKESNILVATDVAARGLDISHIRTVVNYDMAMNIDTHTHRIGRTGRAGEHGVAYTLVTEKDKEMVGHLVRNLESADQIVSEELMNLAMQSAWFQKSRFKQGKGKMIGFDSSRRARPGLGAPKTTPSSNTMFQPFVGSSSTTKQSLSKSTFNPSESSSSSNRAVMMKAAYRSQFRSQFVSATDTSWDSKQKNQTNETVEQPEKKKSRWA